MALGQAFSVVAIMEAQVVNPFGILRDPLGIQILTPL